MKRKSAMSLICSLLLVSCVVIMPVVSSAVYKANVKIVSPYSGTIIKEPVTSVKIDSYLTSNTQRVYVLHHPRGRRNWEVLGRYTLPPEGSKPTPLPGGSIPRPPPGGHPTPLHKWHSFEVNTKLEELGMHDIAAIITNESLKEGDIIDSLPSYIDVSQIIVEKMGVPTPTPSDPGFEAIFAIVGLLAVTYLLGRKR